MGTIAAATTLPSLTTDLLNPVMAQGNVTEGNVTAYNMTGIENITSTSPVGFKSMDSTRY